MRARAITLSCAALALLLASFMPGDSPLPKFGTELTTFDLTLATGPLQTPDYIDAN